MPETTTSDAPIDTAAFDAFSYDRDPPHHREKPTAALWLLRQEIEDFYAYEADLLDQWRYRTWLDLVTEDVRYWMPLRRNVEHGQWSAERSRELEELSWFDENKETLSARVDQLESGVHWVEEPRSRVCHLVTNVRIVQAAPTLEAPDQVVVRSRFLLYRNHLEEEEVMLIGKRRDLLRRLPDPATGDGPWPRWQIAQRAILLDQNVLLAQSLSVLL